MKPTKPNWQWALDGWGNWGRDGFIGLRPWFHPRRDDRVAIARHGPGLFCTCALGAKAIGKECSVPTASPRLLRGLEKPLPGAWRLHAPSCSFKTAPTGAWSGIQVDMATRVLATRHGNFGLIPQPCCFRFAGRANSQPHLYQSVPNCCDSGSGWDQGCMRRSDAGFAGFAAASSLQIEDGRVYACARAASPSTRGLVGK